MSQEPQASLTNPTRSLVVLGRHLAECGYRFTAITPDSHRIIHNRRSALGGHRELVDIFGWNLPFGRWDLAPEVLSAMRAGGLVSEQGETLLARVRFASIGSRLYAHSPFPTDDQDAVFFGPDTYRFVHALRRLIPSCRRLVDVGCGAGAGGLELSDRCEHIKLSDINPLALAYAEANRIINGITAASTVEADVLEGVPSDPDVVIANPPYLMDARHRIYRDGGGGHGTNLAVRIAWDGLDRVRPGGMVLIYTGTPVICGRDVFLARLLQGIDSRACDLEYEELDPDIFGTELANPAYADADRIALVLARLYRRGEPSR